MPLAITRPDRRADQNREARRSSGLATIAPTVLVFVVACAASMLVALANAPYFELVNGIVGARNPVVRSLLYSSWLVLLGGPLVAWRPRESGSALA